jgi:hypothetical protein
VTFASAPDWDSFAGVAAPDGGVSGALGQALGPAREVCLNANVPAGCLAGALVYGLPGVGWEGGSGLSNARWIWRADVAVTQPADLRRSTFEKTFLLCGSPTGSIRVAADDFAAVFVNGVPVGTVGSITDVAAASSGQDVAVWFDLTPALHAGPNAITVAGQNGPASFAGGCGGIGCTYAQNPAGVVFAGTLESH